MATERPPASVDEPPVEEAAAEDAASDLDATNERAWREWTMVALGITGVLSVLAVIIAFSALGSTNPNNVIVQGQATPASSASGSAAGKPESVKLLVKSDAEHGKRGSDGKWHDAFLPADFTVHAGDTVRVTVYNYDDSPHSFTSSSLSSSQLINQRIPAGSATAPSKTTFTFTAPSTPGRYSWWCAIPCDPWAMAHDGFMRGYVSVKA